MAALVDAFGSARPIEGHRPWPRFIVDAETWQGITGELEAGRRSLLGLWGEPDAVHMALLERNEIAVVTLECGNGTFPSVSIRHAPARRLERAVRDLFGLAACTAEPDGLAVRASEREGFVDVRPWLDHARWGVRAPLACGPANPASASHESVNREAANAESMSSEPASPKPGQPYAFLPAEGGSLHEIPVGPVHAGIIEPGHFRFTAAGETVVRLEARLGYVHKGIEGLMRGADLARASRLAGRTSGDSTVAYALAFARAAEAALGSDAPPRAHWLRALMAELERLANHLGDIGAICNDAAFALLQAHCAVLREQILRAAGRCFGHRLMRDCIVPGGVAADLDARGVGTIAELAAEIRRRFGALIELYDSTASLQDRTVGTGVLRRDLAFQYAAGGYVGRASGRAFDARRTAAYPPYGELAFDVPVLEAGDVDARILIRAREIEQSLAMVEQILARMPQGEIRAELPSAIVAGAGEGMALIEGFRGDVLVWLRLAADTSVLRCHLRDPSWFQWPLLEAAIEGNIVADFPLCNKSFNCSYSGHDL